MVDAYSDTGVLIKSYCHETDSRTAVALISSENTPLLLSHFQEAEIRNAVRLKMFRRELSALDGQGALSDIEEDIAAGIFIRPSYSLAAVFHRAENLSVKFTASTGARTLDILHVAAAIEIGCKRFVSFDQRQRKVAARAGLRVVPR